MLFSLHVFEFFFIFLPVIGLQFHTVVARKKFDIISVILLRFVLWPRMRSLLEKIPCAVEKNIYSAVTGWNVL